MILTESDLHAYNRGELPPDAVRQLEDDPLAVQDAARLRAISQTLRQEAPIAVTGRAETLERLRRHSGSRIGVSPWVWATGAACVVGLVVISLPHSVRPSFEIRPALYSRAEATGSAASESAAPDMSETAAPSTMKTQEKELANGATLSSEEARPRSAEATSAPPVIASSPRSAASTDVLLVVKNVPQALSSATDALKQTGARLLRATSGRDESTLTVTATEEESQALLVSLRKLGSVQMQALGRSQVTERGLADSDRNRAEPKLDVQRGRRTLTITIRGGAATGPARSTQR